jgi:hypothetical protein
MPKSRDVAWSFNFVLSCAGFRRENAFFERLQGVVAATDAQQEAAAAKLGTSPHGTGTIWILASRISDAKADDGDNPGKVDWFRFRVEIRFPPNASRLVVPDDWH